MVDVVADIGTADHWFAIFGHFASVLAGSCSRCTVAVDCFAIGGSGGAAAHWLFTFDAWTDRGTAC